MATPDPDDGKIIASGGITNSINIWHAFTTTPDSARSSHIKSIDFNHQLNAVNQLGVLVPDCGLLSPEYNFWNANGRQCCILEDHVTCGPNGGITGTGVIPGANPPKDQHYPGGCQNIDILGAHVYDTNGLNTPWADVMIIPTCNYHNNYQGNWNRSQNSLQPGPLSQMVKPGTPFVVRRIAFQAQVNKGKGGGKGVAIWPSQPGVWAPVAGIRTNYNGHLSNSFNQQ